MILKQEHTLSEKRNLLLIKEGQVETLREEISDLSQLIQITNETKKHQSSEDLRKASEFYLSF